MPVDLHAGVIKEAQFIFKGIVNFVFPWKWFGLKMSEDDKFLWLEGNGVAWGFPLPCRWFPCTDSMHQQGPSISCSGDGLQVLRPSMSLSMSPSFLGRGQHEGPIFPSLHPAAALPGPWHQPAPNYGTTWTPAPTSIPTLGAWPVSL